jgi:hypothetical protein
MHSAMDPDYVPAGDGLDWIDRLDARLCTDTTLPGQFVEQILAALKQHDGDSLRRIGNVLDRKASMLDLTPEQRELFDMVCDLLPHPDKTAIYRDLRRESKARRRNIS